MNKFEMPETFAEDAPKMSERDLIAKYGVSATVVKRWRKALKTAGRPAYLIPHLSDALETARTGYLCGLPAPRKPENDPVLMDSCYYNLQVICGRECRRCCESCGWNPEVQVRRRRAANRRGIVLSVEICGAEGV